MGGVASFKRLPKRFAGMLAAVVGHIAGTASNASRQLEQVVVTTADDSVDFTVTINGTDHVFGSDASATKTEISAGLVALINVGAQAGVVIARDLVESLEVEALVPGTVFTISVAAAGSGVLTLTNLIENGASIGFGLWVIRDQSNTPGRNAFLPTKTTDISTAGRLRGLTLRDNFQESAAIAANSVGYPLLSSMNILETGYGVVLVEDPANVVVGQQVFCRFTATGSEILGSSRTDADGGDAVAVPGCYWDDIPDSDNLVAVAFRIIP